MARLQLLIERPHMGLDKLHIASEPRLRADTQTAQDREVHYDVDEAANETVLASNWVPVFSVRWNCS